MFIKCTFKILTLIIERQYVTRLKLFRLKQHELFRLETISARMIIQKFQSPLFYRLALVLGLLT